jgi:hypothetical protein
MKSVLSIAILFLAPCAVADEAADRMAIESVVSALNDRSRPAADLFTSDAGGTGELARLAELDRTLVRFSGPMSETTPPRLVVRSIRFLTPQVALVDAANIQYGSLILVRSVPVMLVMKKDGDWRIAALRVLMNPVFNPIWQPHYLLYGTPPFITNVTF